MDSDPAPAAFLRDVAFVVYPVKSVTAARAFYEGVLGLKVATRWEDNWVEYDIGAGTLAITAEDARHPAGRHGPTLGVEVVDFAALLQVLQAKGVGIADGPWDSPACLGCVIRDPDGNEIILHHRKPPTG